MNLDKVWAGVRVARTILSLDGISLVSAGAILSEEIISELKKNRITEIYIEDEYSEGISAPEIIREEIITEVKSQMKSIMTMSTIKLSVDGQKITGMVEKLLKSILESENIIVSLSDIRSADDYTYSHSVNVCILSLIIGISMGIKEDKLLELGEGALLHDIGKVMINEDILKKPEHLTVNEFGEVKKHTVCGYDILKNSPGICSDINIIALTHHERFDGSGYPYNLKNNEIPLSARIVAVADVYDALTTDRVYRKKMCPNEVLEYMSTLANKQFDKTVLDAFISHVASFPIGTGVLLNTGEKGIVSKYNPDIPNRPVIRLVMDEAGEILHDHKEIDLSKQLELHIVDVWDI